MIKIPRWTFEKFPDADETLTTQMKSVGEAMAIGRTFKEALQKGIRAWRSSGSGSGWTSTTSGSTPQQWHGRPATCFDTKRMGGTPMPLDSDKTTQGESLDQEWPIPEEKLRRKLAVPSQGRLYYLTSRRYKAPPPGLFLVLLGHPDGSACGAPSHWCRCAQHEHSVRLFDRTTLAGTPRHHRRFGALCEAVDAASWGRDAATTRRAVRSQARPGDDEGACGRGCVWVIPRNHQSVSLALAGTPAGLQSGIGKRST